ncbi:LysM peptidoglycan-binding domain-containing protein [Pelagicoccus mobilis]|uniref:LysM peptidoglycan-binding domain-containing protein n=1 Tax=Pelagicoccus mobilis TaxID=415221 RepID=A0A934RZL9_9BACT|nr:LysM peptidoglycan-binding domain-containing protein [Pelagicoccus mobilis]MBK1879223.1 LysM peptidoglycan-binding domain-containing protein [Pelagicoccus mobilis]
MYKLFAYVSLALATLASSAGATVEHRVRKGETLAEIAKAYKVSLDAIKSANKITNPNRISVGQKLTIPGVSAATGAKHTVRKGETLDAIAKRYKVSIQAIKTANRITNANRIAVGQKLIIPGLKSAQSASSSTTARSGTTHTVKRSETLTEIADAYKVSLDAIKSANNLTNPNQISVGQKLVIPAAGPSYIDYSIRPGDILSEIARDHGVSLNTLTSLNSIRDPGRISIGQIIRIPSSSASAAIVNRSRHPQLPSSFKKTLDRISVRRNQWRHIVIHHSATRSGSARGMDRYHRTERHMENGLAYHFVIGNGRGMKDGEIAIGDRWKKQIQGGHVSSYTLNQISIGICLVGDFSKYKPTAKQLSSLEALVRDLMKTTTVPVDRVTTHTLIHPKHTLCPGKYFPTESFKAKLRK